MAAIRAAGILSTNYGKKIRAFNDSNAAQPTPACRLLLYGGEQNHRLMILFSEGCAKRGVGFPCRDAAMISSHVHLVSLPIILTLFIAATLQIRLWAERRKDGALRTVVMFNSNCCKSPLMAASARIFSSLRSTVKVSSSMVRMKCFVIFFLLMILPRSFFCVRPF